MLQEKQELNEPLKQSTSFLVLQETLESEENGDPNKSSGFRSVKALVTKVVASIGNAQKLPMCDRCGTRVGVFMTLRDHHRHPVLPVHCLWHQLKEKAISWWRIRSTVKSMPGIGSLHPKATTWSQCPPSEPAVLAQCCSPSSPCCILPSKSSGLSLLPSLRLLWFYCCSFNTTFPFANASCWLCDARFYN